MTASITLPRTAADSRQTFAGTVQKALREKFPPRPALDAWPVTSLGHEAVLDLVETFSDGVPRATHDHRRRAAEKLLCWLETFLGTTWQQRWHNSPAESDPQSWSDLFGDWLRGQGRGVGTKGNRTTGALTLIRADVIRPGLAWLITSHSPHLRSTAATFRDPEGFAALKAATARTTGRAGWPHRPHTRSRC